MSLRILIFFIIGFFTWSYACYPAGKDKSASSSGYLSSASAAISAVARVEHPLGIADLAGDSGLWQEAVGSMISSSRSGRAGIETSYLRILCFPDQSGLIVQIESPDAGTCWYKFADQEAVAEDIMLPGLSDETAVLDLSTWASAVSSDSANITITIINSAI